MESSWPRCGLPSPSHRRKLVFLVVIVLIAYDYGVVSELRLHRRGEGDLAVNFGLVVASEGDGEGRFLWGPFLGGGGVRAAVANQRVPYIRGVAGGGVEVGAAHLVVGVACRRMSVGGVLRRIRRRVLRNVRTRVATVGRSHCGGAY